MPAPLLDQRDLDFMLYELFDVEAITTRERYADHNRESFDAAINSARVVAEKYFLSIRQKVDTHQPTFDGQRVQIVPEIKLALDASHHAADQRFYQGKLQVMRYFFRFELPEIAVWARLLLGLDDTT
jgi:hypothetical protein